MRIIAYIPLYVISAKLRLKTYRYFDLHDRKTTSWIIANLTRNTLSSTAHMLHKMLRKLYN